jgi:hypothetical protein
MNQTVNCGYAQYELTHDQVKRMLYAIEYLAVSETTEHFTKAQELARQCLAEQGRPLVTIPVGAIVEAI